jgi:hypothetical protein
MANVAVQVGGQSIPDGWLVTWPGPWTVTRRVGEPDAAALTAARSVAMIRMKRTAEAIALPDRRRSAAEI